MKIALAIAILTLLALFMPILSVEALTAASVADAATFTSLNSGTTYRAWLNPAGTIAYFVDCLQQDVKIIKVNMTDGSTISSSTITPGNGGSNTCAISEVFTLSGVNYVVYAQRDGSVATTLAYDRINIDSGAFSSATGATTCTTATTASTIYVTKNRIYFIMNNNNNSSMCTAKANLDLTGFATIGNALLNNLLPRASNKCEVTVDGSTETTDVAYCVLPAGTSVTVAKFTNGVYSSLGTFGVVQHDGSPPEAFRSGNYILMRATMTSSPFTETTVILNTATDTFTTLGTVDYTNRNMQAQHLTDSTRAYTPSPQFLANATAIRSYDTAGNIEAIDMPAINVDNSTASISWFSDTFYRPKADVFVTGTTTTWTPKVISGVDISPVPYSEGLTVPLLENQTLFLTPVFKIICDAPYDLPSGIITVGDDSDCVGWRTVEVATDTIGRNLNYERTRELVHAVGMLGYTIHVSAAAPEQYFLTTIYDGKDVDSIGFDSAGDAAELLMYGQCYTMEIEESVSGNILLSGEICANDVNPKTVSLTGITLPDEWLGTIWSHQITRYFNASDAGAPASANSTNNHVLFTLEKSLKPYNASINIVDHPDETYRTLDEWHNFTSVTGVIVVNRTGIFSNQTLYFSVLENGVVVLNDVSQGRLSPGNIDLVSWADNYGLLFGVPIALIFPVLTAAVFPRSQAHIGVIATGAVLGIEQYFGLLKDVPFNEGLWAVAFGLIALGVMYAKR